MTALAIPYNSVTCVTLIASVVKWISRRSSEPLFQVRILAEAPENPDIKPLHRYAELPPGSIRIQKNTKSYSSI